MKSTSLSPSNDRGPEEEQRWRKEEVLPGQYRSMACSSLASSSRSIPHLIFCSLPGTQHSLTITLLSCEFFLSSFSPSLFISLPAFFFSFMYQTTFIPHSKLDTWKHQDGQDTNVCPIGGAPLTCAAQGLCDIPLRCLKGLWQI